MPRGPRGEKRHAFSKKVDSHCHALALDLPGWQLRNHHMCTGKKFKPRHTTDYRPPALPRIARK